MVKRAINTVYHFIQRHIYLICFFIFMIWQLLLIIHYNGWYSYDELYHISSSNPAFHEVSLYDRAPYINESIRFLSSILGRSYYTYKLIPFVMSLISMAILLYLLKELSSHYYPAILAALIMCGHSLLIFNHLYIRMYVWDEAVIAILALILYRLPRIRSFKIRLVVHILYFFTASIWYILQTYEESALSVLAVGVAAWLMYQIGYPIIMRLKEKRHLGIALIILGLLIAAVETYIVCIRLRVLPIPGFLSSHAGMFFRSISEEIQGFSVYFATKGILFTVGIIGYGYILLKKELKKETLGIYTLALLPFLAYNMLYFDQWFFRAYASYLPMAVLVTILWLDHFSARKFLYYAATTFAVLATILFSYIGLAVKTYFRAPYIHMECRLENYGGMVAKAQENVENGRKCIAIWLDECQMAVFESDLDTEYAIALENSVNRDFGYTKEDLRRLTDYLENTQQPYILFIGTHCERDLNSINPDFLPMLLETYHYDQYDSAYLFYIN